MMKIYLNKKKRALIAVASSLFIFGSVHSQLTYSFTTAGATGSLGPTQGQINTAYASTNLNGSVTILTQGIQSFTIPVTGMYRIEAIGAGGGSVTVTCPKNGGMGARVAGDFSLTAGTVLKVLVGQQGASNGSDAGGGGGSFVATLSNSILVAGGGGGGASNNITQCGAGQLDGINATITTSGTASGNNAVAGGINGNGGGASTGSGGGGGGFLTDGIAGTGLPGNNGKAFVNGGIGGTGNNSDWGGFGGGGAGWFTGGNGGGGGGYSGGATSGSQPFTGGGGAGSYNGGTNQTNTAAYNSGDGRVFISQLYSAMISQSTAISCNASCNGVLTATVIGGTAPYTYTWLPTGGNSTVAANLCAGVYTLVVMDNLSQTATSTYTLTQPAVLSTSLVAVSNASCYGSANASATVAAFGATSPYTYTWSPVGGSTTIATGLAAGIYSCSIKDANNCSVSVVTVNITQPAQITGTASSPGICSGNTVVLNGVGATSYTWTSPVNNGVPFSPTITSTYSVSGTNSITGCSGTGTVLVTVDVTPTVAVNNQTICAGQTISLSPSGASTYSYSSGNGVVNPSSTTVYTVTGASTFGCLSTPVSVTVVVNTCTGLSESNKSSSSLMIYPNPANNSVKVSLTEGMLSRIQLLDYTGKLIKEISNISASTMMIDISSLSDGVYFINVQTDIDAYQLKLIKQN